MSEKDKKKEIKKKEKKEFIKHYSNYMLSDKNREKIEGFLDGKKGEKDWVELVLLYEVIK